VVVDDHPDTADTLATLLRLEGHEAVSVVDPRQAVAAAKALKPQLAMLRLFRLEPELKHTCLVAITAETQDKYARLTRQAGFDAYLKTPVDLAMLRSVIAQFGN
jgi:CheY-like chemotaxis protein